MDTAALKARATAAFKSFSPAQLTVMGLLVAALLVGGMTFMRWAAAPSYGVLFSGLDAKDASEVVDKIKAEGVPYKLVSDGTAIMVPTSKVYDLRLSLSAEGLPKGSVVGYEILNNQGLTTSEFSQQVNYQRAVEGELTRTLSAMKGIESASIHLAIPRDELFTDSASEPTAAVLLTTDGSLGDDAVESIVHLVASSVPGMKPQGVTVADTDGNVLSSGSGASGNSNKELRLTQQYESALATNANAMLQQVYGAGHSIVRVSARMNYDTKETQTETYDPESQVALSESTTQETYKSGSAAAGTTATGTLGDTSGASSTDSPPTDYQKSESAKDFGVNKVVESAKVAPGKVERLSVAVMLDSAAKPAPDADQVRELVGAALGVDVARGDQIVVDTISFSKDAATAGASAAAEGAAASPMLDYARTGIGIVILGIVLFVLLRGMRKTKVEIVDLGGGVRPMLSGTGQPMALGAPATDIHGRELVAVGAGSTQQQMLSLVDQQPDEVAVLLRSWLGDRG